jgi:hypothetical protein
MRKAQLLAVAVLFLLACLPAAAQVKVQKVNLPFAFQIGDDKLDAGAYSFSQETRNDQMLVQGGKAGRLLLRTSPLEPENAAEKDHTTLIFHKISGKYFLNQLWSKHIGFQMPTSAAEKELIAGGQQPSEVKVNVKTN